MAKVMAKTKAKKVKPEIPPAGEAQEPVVPISFERVHGLFGMAAHTCPSHAVAMRGFATFWDRGVSIRSLVKSHRELF